MSEVYYTDEKEWKLELSTTLVIWFKVGYKLKDHEYHPGFLSGDTSYVTVRVPSVQEFSIISFECYDNVGDPIKDIPAMTPLCNALASVILLQMYKLDASFNEYVNTAVIEAHNKYKREGYYE